LFKELNKFHVIGLAIFLIILWLLLSGHYTPLLIGLGMISVILVVIISTRMDVVDQEGHPFHLNFLELASYWVWLLKEIVKANIEVCKIILRPSLPISPTLVTIKSKQATDLGRVIYANSITLTPGTISINVTDGEIEVHALTKAAANELQEDEMNRRVAKVEAKSSCI